MCLTSRLPSGALPFRYCSRNVGYSIRKVELVRLPLKWNGQRHFQCTTDYRFLLLAVASCRNIDNIISSSSSCDANTIRSNTDAYTRSFQSAHFFEAFAQSPHWSFFLSMFQAQSALLIAATKRESQEKNVICFSRACACHFHLI